MLTRALLTTNPDHRRGAQPVCVPVLGLAIGFGAEQGSYDTIQDGVRQSVMGHRVVCGTSGQGDGALGHRQHGSAADKTGCVMRILSFWAGVYV